MSRYLIAGLVLALVLALWRIDNVSSDRDAAQGQAEQAQQHASDLQDALDGERARAKTQADIDTAYQKGITDGQAQLDGTLSDLRADVIRLRGRFRCPASGMPAATPGAAGSDGAAPGGLQREDAEFLVRLASEADALALQLNACQAVIRSDRGDPK